MEHPYHRKKSHFNSQEENHEATFAITSDYIILNGEKIMHFIENGDIPGSKNDPLNDSVVK